MGYGCLAVTKTLQYLPVGAAHANYGAIGSLPAAFPQAFKPAQPSYHPAVVHEAKAQDYAKRHRYTLTASPPNVLATCLKVAIFSKSHHTATSREKYPEATWSLPFCTHSHSTCVSACCCSEIRVKLGFPTHGAYISKVQYRKVTYAVSECLDNSP